MDEQPLPYKALVTEALARLNAHQRKAAELTGPVLVLGGPGTGKTEVLAIRIARLVTLAGIDPRHILCLTDTHTGCADIRNRLTRLVGPDACRVAVHTWHSLSKTMIRDHPSCFGNLSKEPVSALEAFELFRELIDGLGSDHPLKNLGGNPYREIPALGDLFTRMKKEAWAPGFMQERIDAYLSELSEKHDDPLANQMGFESGAPDFHRVTGEMQILRAAVDLYPRYQQLLEAAGRYTPDDVLVWVLNAFREKPALLSEYPERFAYLLIDEFQEVSGLDRQLLGYLSGCGHGSHIFVTADATAARVASGIGPAENIRYFMRRYQKDLHRIVLKDHYRTTPSILKAARAVLLHDKTPLFPDDPLPHENSLVVYPEGKEVDAPVRIIAYPDPLLEATGVARQIAVLLKNGVRPSEIAVIYRDDKMAGLLEEVLEKNRIPVNREGRVSLPDQPLVRDILDLLRYVVSESEAPYSGDAMLFEILHDAYFRIPPVDIARISMTVSRNHYGLPREKHSLRRAIREQAASQPELFSSETFSELKTVSQVLEKLISQTGNLTPPELLEAVIRDAGIWAYIHQSPDKSWLLHQVENLAALVSAETTRKPDGGIKGLVNTIGQMTRLHLPVSLQKRDFQDEGVNLLDAGDVKGRHFTHVLLPDATENTWDQKKTVYGELFALPGNLYGTKDLFRTLEASRRLFYQTMRRAGIFLEISYAVSDRQGTPQSPSVFLSEMMQETEILFERAAIENEALAGGSHLGQSTRRVPEIQLIDAPTINRRLKRYALSVTHLNNFLSCPLKFYYENFIRVPQTKSAAMIFGSAVHFALQRLFERMGKQGGSFPSLEVMMADFSWYMHRNREAFAPEEFFWRMEHADKVLRAYYDDQVAGWNTAVAVEWSIRGVQVNGVPLNGKVDKIEKEDIGVKVVDYKTGSFAKAAAKMNGPDDQHPQGGDYWRQAVFYKILLDRDPRGPFGVSSVEFDFVEPVNGRYQRVSIPVSARDVAVVTSQITDVWSRIQAHEFSRGCGKANCRWCHFVRENNLAVKPSGGATSPR